MTQDSQHPFDCAAVFRGGYLDGDICFTISGLGSKGGAAPEFVSRTLNALLRGAPTKPSEKLLVDLEIKELDNTPLYLQSRSLISHWHNTIKGGDKKNPASEFYHSSLVKNLREYSFAASLVIPEFPLFRYLQNPNNDQPQFSDERVDFYLPQADLVIEIDGIQHKEIEQNAKDARRDAYLKRFGIHTVRVDVKDFDKQGDTFSAKMEEIREACYSAERVSPYRELCADSRPLSDRHYLTAAFRLQVAICSAVLSNVLDVSHPEWGLKITSDLDQSGGPDWKTPALDDLFEWFELFSKFTGEKFAAPKIIDLNNTVQFEIQLFGRLDDRTVDDGIIMVQTCHVQDMPNAKGQRVPFDPPSKVAKSKAEQRGVLENLEALKTLNKRMFGFDAFRPGQLSLITNALLGEASLGLMPTGGGKSLCFHLVGNLRRGCTIVVVPIKALGRDHVAELEAAGFSGRVAKLDSDMPKDDQKQILDRLNAGKLRFLFVSPERFQHRDFRPVVSSLHDSNKLGLLVVDEVHCVSEWGHDFRPAYLTLAASMRELAPKTPVMCLTATASINVLRDIQNDFKIDDDSIAYEMHRSRKELNFAVEKALSSPENIAKRLGVIYSGSPLEEAKPPIHIFSRYVTEKDEGVHNIAAEVARRFPELRVGVFSGKPPQNFEMQVYLKWLKTTEKPENYAQYKFLVQSLWKQNKLDVIVTTKAFGMGVNKPNVRYTIHAGMPSSMEAFYQEAGRAGRDGNKAMCKLLYKPEIDDINKLWKEIEKDNSPSSISAVSSRVSKQREGDIRKQLFFQNSGNLAVEVEKAALSCLHAKIVSTPNEVLVLSRSILPKGPSFGENRKLQNSFQIIVYRLFQLRLIEPWSVVDWSNGDAGDVESVRVIKNGITFEEACNALIKEIHAIAGARSQTSFEQSLLALKGKRDRWEALFEILLAWNRSAHFKSRLQSIWNLYEACEDFKLENAVNFREKLEAFFKIDKEAFQLGELRDTDLSDAPKIIKAFCISEDGSIKSSRQLQKINSQLLRQLEASVDSKTLRLAQACIGLVSPETSDFNVVRRNLDAALPGGLMHYMLSEGEEILNLLSRTNSGAVEKMSEWLLEEATSIADVRLLHEKLPSNQIASVLFEDLSNNLEALL